MQPNKKHFYLYHPLKQLASILLIAIFAFSQYAKQFAYMECKLSNSFSNSSLKCDCEKKFDLHTLNEKVPLSSPTHSHPSLIDDFYTSSSCNEIQGYSSALLNKNFFSTTCTILQGINNTPYRPPQS